jgi:hypothetical protein
LHLGLRNRKRVEGGVALLCDNRAGTLQIVAWLLSNGRPMDCSN